MLHADFILSIGTFDAAQRCRPANRANIDATCSEHFNWQAGKRRRQMSGSKSRRMNRARQTERGKRNARIKNTGPCEHEPAHRPPARMQGREMRARQNEKPCATSGMKDRSHAAAFAIIPVEICRFPVRAI